MTQNNIADNGSTKPKRIRMGTLRKSALSRLGVGPRNREKLNAILDLGIAALDRNAAATTTVAPRSEATTSEDRGSVLQNIIMGQHKCFGALLAIVKAGLHAYIVGPAGSGKTTAAEHCAKEIFGTTDRFYCMSVGAQTSKADLLGYMNATGSYITTVFRRAFEFGGLFLLDEIDAGNANVLTILNAALANGVCSFPDGMITRHPEFICIAAANTFGTGADRQYVGRNQLDAASIDRFAFLEWPYDEVLEAQISPVAEWTAYVQKVRAAVAALKLRHVVSPRASISGGKLLKAGVSRKAVEESVLWKGLDAVSRAKVLAVVV